MRSISTLSEDDIVSDKSEEPDRSIIWTFDLETNNKNKDNRAFDASPFYEYNQIVAGCWMESKIVDGAQHERSARIFHRAVGDESAKLLDENEFIFPKPFFMDAWNEKLNIDAPWFLCGHNVLFDLQYMRRIWEGAVPCALFDCLKAGTTLLWDTQLAQYLLSGQKDRMLSLNQVSEIWGLPSKLEGVKDLWDAGIETEDIDPETLVRYLYRDTELTEAIAKRQIAYAYDIEMLPFIEEQMRSLFVIGEYQHNGMQIENSMLESITERAAEEMDRAREGYELLLEAALLEEAHCTQDYLDAAVGVALGNDGMDRFLKDITNISSSKHLKHALAGVAEEVEIRVPNSTYKSGQKKGQVKYSRVKVTIPWSKIYAPVDLSSGNVPDICLTETGKKKKEVGGDLKPQHLSLGESALKEYTKNMNSCLGDAVQEYHKYKVQEKVKNTYCKSLDEYRFDNGKIHPSYNTTVTPTGRISCSEPNLQNIPTDEDIGLKRVFTSRFDEGLIATVDFKQLEVVALAYLSGDEQLQKDLKDGVDIHETIGKIAGFGTSMQPELRRTIKGIVFGSIYGAGVEILVEQSGWDLNDVIRCKEALSTRYPRAFRDFSSYVGETLRKGKVIVGRNDIGNARYGSYLPTPSGRIIYFETQRGGAYDKDAEVFKYTNRRNWPVQSFAYDIVSVARVLFYEETQRRVKDGDLEILMINEVHDEIVFDLGRRDAVPKFERILQQVEDYLPEALMEAYDLPEPFPLPLKIEYGTGENWMEAK